MGRPIVIDNRAGGGGIIASELAARARPGGSTHLATEIFKLRTGTSMSMTSVSYKGGAAVQIALAAGEVQIAFLTATSMLPQISTGKIKAIAVAAPKRVRYLPDVPTLEEAGAPSVEASPWPRLLAPAGTPRDIINRVQAETVKTRKQKNTIDRLAALGADPVGSTPEEFHAKLARELKEFGRIIPQLGLAR